MGASLWLTTLLHAQTTAREDGLPTILQALFFCPLSSRPLASNIISILISGRPTVGPFRDKIRPNLDRCPSTDLQAKFRNPISRPIHYAIAMLDHVANQQTSNQYTYHIT
jgi:hypothetical protein